MLIITASNQNTCGRYGHFLGQSPLPRPKNKVKNELVGTKIYSLVSKRVGEYYWL